MNQRRHAVIHGFSWSHWRGDLSGGLTAAVVALPLALAFGNAALGPGGAIYGLYGAIVTGFLAALLGGTPAQVSGPTGPMSVTVAGVVGSLAAVGVSRELSSGELLPLVMAAVVIACCFSNLRRQPRDSVQRKVALLYPFLKSELQLEWTEAQLPQIAGQFIDSMIDEGLLETLDGDLRRPSRSDHGFIQLMRLAQIVQPILERYYMTFILLWQTTNDPLDEKQLEHRCHLLAQKISMIYGINSPDFFDRLLFRDFIATLLDQGYLCHDDDKRLVFDPDFDFVNLDVRNLLSTEVRSSILAIIRASPD